MTDTFYDVIRAKICKVDCQYMKKQDVLTWNMRQIIIDWLVEVHVKFLLKPAVLYLTVQLLDRFLEKKAVTKGRLQLLGCACMFLASKYHEIYAPELSDFVAISDKAYTRDAMLAMEVIIINTLEFRLSLPTLDVFISELIRPVMDDDKEDEKKREQFKNLVEYLCAMSLQHHEFLEFTPEEVAFAAIRLAKQYILELCNLAEMNACEQCLLKKAQDMKESKYKAIYRSYCRPKYNEIARLVETKIV